MVLIKEECVGLAGNKLNGIKRGVRVKKKRQTWRRWINLERFKRGLSQISLCANRDMLIEFQS